VEVRLHERLQEPLDHRPEQRVGNRRNPDGLVLPSPFGMSTLRTGGG